MYSNFIKSLLPLPSFFEVSLPSDEEPTVFPVKVGAYTVPCPLCQKKTIRHAQMKRRFRHSYGWHVGLIWIEIMIPRHRCFSCDLTFTYDFDLGLVQASSAMFRKEIFRRCHNRSIADVAREYGLPYTTVERWFYLYAPDELPNETATNICIDEFALRKGHNYATSVLNADTGRILAIVPRRDENAITAVLQKVTGPIRSVVSDFAPAMANAIHTVYPTAIHVLDRFHLVQFFTDAQQRRRRYLGEAKKHHKSRFIDRCLARRPEQLTEEEREFVAQWQQEDFTTK
ncbi:MAG: ISL3 family transposase, partial [Bacilli bacterium]